MTNHWPSNTTQAPGTGASGLSHSTVMQHIFSENTSIRIHNRMFLKLTKICDYKFFSSKQNKSLSLHETILMDIQV